MHVVCRTVMDRPMCQASSTSLHFVDDRSETLLHIAKQADLSRWQLYFADWCACHCMHTCAASNERTPQSHLRSSWRLHCKLQGIFCEVGFFVQADPRPTCATQIMYCLDVARSMYVMSTDITESLCSICIHADTSSRNSRVLTIASFV